MVYWGCGTTKNRCMWAFFAAAAVLGSLLLIAGGTKLDICSKLPLKMHISAGACSAGPVAMMVIGAFTLLGTIPSLLFFSGCATGPPKAKYSEGVQASGITVVRRTSDGPQVFHYDAAGRLIAAPDCKKHAVKSSQYVLKGIKTAPALHGDCSSNSSTPSGTPRHPLLGGFQGRLFGDSESGDAATAEVYVSAVIPQPQQQHYQSQQCQHAIQQQLGRSASPHVERCSPQPHLGPLAAGRILAAQQQQERELQMQRQQQLQLQHEHQQEMLQEGHSQQQLQEQQQ